MRRRARLRAARSGSSRLTRSSPAADRPHRAPCSSVSTPAQRPPACAATSAAAATSGGSVASAAMRSATLSPSAERAVGPDPAVLHDLQARAPASPAEAVGGVGKPVLVERAGQQRRRPRRRAAPARAPLHTWLAASSTAADSTPTSTADQRKIFRRRAAASPARSSLADGTGTMVRNRTAWQEMRELAHGVRRGTTSLRSATSVSSRAAARSSGAASTAPVPSPSRMPRSSSGVRADRLQQPRVAALGRLVREHAIVARRGLEPDRRRARPRSR